MGFIELTWPNIIIWLVGFATIIYSVILGVAIVIVKILDKFKHQVYDI